MRVRQQTSRAYYEHANGSGRWHAVRSDTTTKISLFPLVADQTYEHLQDATVVGKRSMISNVRKCKDCLRTVWWKIWKLCDHGLAGGCHVKPM